MTWVVFSYSLPSKAPLQPAGTLWRRCGAGGDLAMGGMHILPGARRVHRSLPWLAQEVQQAQGEALVMQVEHFEGSLMHSSSNFSARHAQKTTQKLIARSRHSNSVSRRTVIRKSARSCGRHC